MMQIRRIDRDFHCGRYGALLLGLASGSEELPMALRLRLSQHPAAAVALGLRRLIELTYQPTDLSREMTRQLLSLQDADGSFGQDPLATACAVAALGRLLHEQSGLDDPAGVAAARRRALDALAARQDQDADESSLPGFAHPADRTVQDRAAVAALILCLLADDAEFRQAVRFAPLMDWFEEHRRKLDPVTANLWRRARLEIAKPRHRAAPKAIAA